MEELRLQEVIQNGKLKTYDFGGSCIKVYWQLESLPPNTYYLFKFTELEGNLLDFKKVEPRYLPVKYKARTYNSTMTNLVTSLLN